MLTQELKNLRRPARTHAFAHAQSNSPQWVVLSAQVASLQKTVLTLQGEVNALSQELAKIQANNVQALDPFVSVDPNSEAGVAGPNIIFRGANIHILSGSGATDDGGKSLGLGNLIIGYDEDPSSLGRGDPLNPGDRGGSHNLVIGRGHRFTQAAFGCFVAGEINTISNRASSVSGGRDNTASGESSSVNGGDRNTASGRFASVGGGHGNTASGRASSVSGGQNNTASGESSSVLGGEKNTAGPGALLRRSRPYPHNSWLVGRAYCRNAWPRC